MIHTYSFYPIDARMYLLVEGTKALVIDPCRSEDALQLLKVNGVTELLIVLTHEHYDHVSGVNWLRKHFSSVQVLCSSKCAKALPMPSENLSIYWEILFMGKDAETQEYVRNMNIQPYACEADQSFDGEYEMLWEKHTLLLKETPGHSRGSICILLDGRYLFSGDSLVTGYPTVTRLPGGSKKDYATVTVPFLKSLNPELMVYPGHGDRQQLKGFKL